MSNNNIDAMTMRAFVIASAQDNLAVLSRVPLPQIDSEELLVRVKAVGVGVHDAYFLPADVSYPYPIGIEAAGVVQDVGAGVEGYLPGDRIAFVSSKQVKGGTWAEFAAVRSDSLIVPIPEDLDFAQAAAVPVAGNTAFRAFHALPILSAGDSIFVAGASGAIGTFLVQLAADKGLQVGASASPRNHEYLISLGASKTVDYHDANWPDEIRRWSPQGVQAALAVQPQTTADSASVVMDGGTVVTISGDHATPGRGVRVVHPEYGVDVREELSALMDRIASGNVRLELEHVHPFEDALSALAKVQTRHARGKTVLSLS